MSRHSTRVLEVGTRAHYEDGIYYAHRYKRRVEDINFYVHLAHHAEGAVLELGCGTGRVTLAIAKQHIPIVGIDAMPAMLKTANQAKAKLDKKAQSYVTFKKADMTRLRLRKKFPLIIAPFNVMMHVYSRSELEQVFATVRAHLTPESFWVFDVLMPDLQFLSRNPQRVYRADVIYYPTDQKKYRYAEMFDYDPISQVQLVTMLFENAQNKKESFVTPMTHRYFFPQELLALLHYNGFDVVEQYGDFNRNALGTQSESQIYVTKLRKGFR